MLKRGGNVRKKIKIFKSGKYRQGEYDKERVKNIFSKAKETDAIFLHSSLWAKNEKPLNLGKFSNYEFKDADGEIEVFADLELNETGKKFYSGKVLNGVSVELPNDELTKIAILPNKVNPAVEGAEFQEAPIFMEFQEIEEKKSEKKGKGEDKTMDKTEVLNSLTKEEIQGQAQRLNIEVKEKLKAKTPEEIEADIKAKLKKEYADKEKVSEFMKENEKKILPAFKPFFEKMAEESLKSEVNWEFNKKDTTLFEGLQEFMKQINEFSGFKNYSDNVEFNDQGTNENSPFKQGQKAVEGGN